MGTQASRTAVGGRGTILHQRDRVNPGRQTGLGGLTAGAWEWSKGKASNHRSLLAVGKQTRGKLAGMEELGHLLPTTPDSAQVVAKSLS